MKKSEHLSELAAPESDQSRELGAKGINPRLLKEAAGFMRMKKKCVFYKHSWMMVTYFLFASTVLSTFHYSIV